MQSREMTPILRGIHHIAINCADYERTKEFYVNLLGFEILGEYRFPNGTKRLDCQLGTSRLEIFWSESYAPRPQGRLQGYRHLCFRVANAQQTADWLKVRGVSVTDVRPDPMTGENMAFFYDPDGLELEIHE